jgi:hypothetical protein
VSTIKVPKYRELRITNTPEGVVVDFFPDMFVVPVVEKEPTESNPDIKLDLGKIGGEIAPLKAYYPPGTSVEEIMNKVDVLFEKVQWCPNCERKKRMVLARLKTMMEEKGKGEVFEKMMSEAQKKAEAKKAQPERPPEKQFAMEQASVPAKKPLEQRAQENLMGAIDNAYVAVRGFFVPPVRPIRPDDWLKIVSGERKA